MVPAAIIYVFWQSALAAAPTPVLVIAATDDVAVTDKARQLAAELAHSEQLAVQSDIGIARQGSGASAQDLDEAQYYLAEGQRHFEAMQITEAISSLARAQTILLAHASSVRGARMLAKVCRFRGRVFLADQQSGAADEQFAAAARLDPDFVPPADDWPPPARLAFADAVASARRKPGVSLSIHVQPPYAQLWLDGAPVGVGPTTLASAQSGLHVLFAAGVGLAPMSMLVRVSDSQPSTDVSVFVESLPARESRQAAVDALAAGGDADSGEVTVRQALAVLAPEQVLLLRHNGAGKVSARWLSTAASPNAGSVTVDDPAEAAAMLMAMQSLPAPAVASSAAVGLLAKVPWYAWTIGAVVVAGAATAGIVAATHH